MKTSRLTGIGYLIIFLTGLFANFLVLESLWVKGDALVTAENIQSQFGQFQLGFLAFAIMVLMDILLAFPLYKLLKPVHEKLSRISSGLRFVNGLIFLVALVKLAQVFFLFQGETGPVSAEMGQETLALLNGFNDIWLIGLVFFGAHLLLLGTLIFRSGYLPKLIGILLFTAGLGYLADSFGRLLPEYENYKMVFEIAVIIPGVIGEFSLTLWLLIKAPSIPETAGTGSPKLHSHGKVQEA